jgi:carbonic anhydrase
MDPLIEGYRRFRAEIWPAERARYEALAHWGQSPEAMVVACSDSRVDPQTVFDAAPGELFVVRNVAAFVPVSRTRRCPSGCFSRLTGECSN